MTTKKNKITERTKAYIHNNFHINLNNHTVFSSNLNRQYILEQHTLFLEKSPGLGGRRSALLNWPPKY